MRTDPEPDCPFATLAAYDVGLLSITYQMIKHSISKLQSFHCGKSSAEPCNTIRNIVWERDDISLKSVEPTWRWASPAAMIDMTWPGDSTISSFRSPTYIPSCKWVSNQKELGRQMIQLASQYLCGFMHF